jgi:hypothetical protein
VNELESIWKEIVMAYPKYYPATGAEESNETRPDRDSNRTPPKYKFTDVSLHQPVYTFTANEVIPGG